MPKFAANLTMLFNEVPFLDRFEAALKAGFKGVEYLFPYEYKKEELAERLRRCNLVQVLHNLPAGNWAAGERGIACLPGRTGEFQESVGKAAEYAKALGCKTVNCLAGKAPQGADLYYLLATDGHPDLRNSCFNLAIVASTSSSLRGIAPDMFTGSPEVTRMSSSMRTPMPLYFSKAGRTALMNRSFCGVFGKTSSASGRM